MKFTIVSIGKAHDKLFAEAIESYSLRIGNYFPVTWEIIPPAKHAASLTITELKKTEAEAILAKVQPEDHLVLLDERGLNISSIDMADKINHQILARTKRIVFLIGGAYGVGPVIFQRANLVWGFSKLVFPHMLVRLMLAEQLYRACTIIRNENYHHV